jgi:hypothetical protein
MSDWAGVRERVSALREVPSAVEVFGAYGGHQFLLEEPLGADALGELEARLGVRLPEEYRDFLLTVGAGGAGPAYGVFPVRRTDAGEWYWYGHGGHLIALDLMGTPFPERHSTEIVEELEDSRPREAAFGTEAEYEAAHSAYLDRVVDVLWAPDRTAGAICLCHEGCDMRVWLVVSGAERGRMFSDLRCDDVDLAPIIGSDGQAVTFRQWYLKWLEKAETECGVGPR